MTEAAQVHRRIAELYPEALATGRFDEALALVDPAVIDHRGGADGDHFGLAAWHRKWERMSSDRDGGFRDTTITIAQNVAAGDTSVNRYTFRGTDPATGRSYTVTGLDMVRVRDGKIAEHWALLDTIGMQHQLGRL